MPNWEAKLFIDYLFGSLRPKQSQCITLMAIHPDKTHPQQVRIRHTLTTDTQEFEQNLENLYAINQLGWGAYIGIATRVPGLSDKHSGTLNDLVALPAFYIDNDTSFTTEAYQQMISSDRPPSCILYSGFGIHSYYFLDECTSNFQLADTILHNLAAKYGTCTFSATQPMRIPGTINTKYGNSNAICHILDINDRRYRVEDFLPEIALIPSQKLIHKREKGISLSHRTQFTHNYYDPLNPQLIQTIIDTLKSHYGGFERTDRSGKVFIGAYCPCPHNKDHPGSHFYFNPRTGLGHCFGRHQRFYLDELCPLIAVDPNHYGGYYEKSLDQHYNILEGERQRR